MDAQVNVTDSPGDEGAIFAAIVFGDVLDSQTLQEYDEFPVMVGVNENPNFGLLGQLNYGLYRTVRGPLSHDTVSDLSRAVFGGIGATVGNLMVSVPWTGSFAPGVSFARTGSNYTWTKDYG